jgi:GST-like protein
MEAALSSDTLCYSSRPRPLAQNDRRRLLKSLENDPIQHRHPQGPQMIDLYTWTTPNGRKASIALEEFKLPYTVHPIDITKDQQFAPEFLNISPNNKIPAIVDHETGVILMESGAILIYLADKTGQLLPTSGAGRYRVLEWLMWQMGGPGPTFAQLHYYFKFNKGKVPLAEERFMKETRRLYSVLDKRLSDREFVAEDYSIADIAIWPWVSRFEWQSIKLQEYPNVLRWYTDISQRTAVQRGYKIPLDVGNVPLP